MCEKCAELDLKVERCRRLIGGIADQIAIEGIGALLKSYQAEKTALHPEQKQGDSFEC
jgi:hypothetical protein